MIQFLKCNSHSFPKWSIYVYHACGGFRVFLGELESCQQDAVRLAQCFVDQNEGFVIYSDYCTNYPG